MVGYMNTFRLLRHFIFRGISRTCTWACERVKSASTGAVDSAASSVFAHSHFAYTSLLHLSCEDMRGRANPSSEWWTEREQ